MISRSMAGLKTLYPSEPGATVFCTDNFKEYIFIPDAKKIAGNNVAPTADDIVFVITGAGGDSRWLLKDYRPFVKFYKTGTQASGAGADTVISWHSKDDIFALGDLTNFRFGGAGVANGVPLGRVRVYGQFRISSAVDQAAYQARIFKNGANVAAFPLRASGTGSNHSGSSDVITIGDKTDRLELIANTPTSLTITDEVVSTFFIVSYETVVNWRLS